MSKTTTLGTDRARKPGHSKELCNTLSVHVTSGQGRSTLHGNSYHLRLGLVVMLRGLRMYHEDREFNFLIAMEDPVGKDFDDIMYHYSFGQRSTGTICIQAKHRRSDSDAKHTEQDKSSLLTEGLLHAPWDGGKSSFSIAKYFLSFLEVEQHLQTDTRTYVLCTNRVLDKNLAGQFIEREQQHSEDVLHFCYDIGSRCYQINPQDTRLTEQLINSSLSKLGKLMANDVFKGKKMVFKNSIYHSFAGLINECLEPSEEFVTEEVEYKFREIFFDEPSMMSMEVLKLEFLKEYKRLLNNDRVDVTESMRSALIRIDQSSFSSALSNAESLEQSISKFYKSFVLVCQTPNDEELCSNAIALLPKWASHELVLDKLHRLLFDAMKSATPVPIDLKFLQKMFMEIDPNKEITILKSKSKEYLSSLEQSYTHIKVKPGCLTDSKLNKFVASKDVSGIYEYSSLLDVNVSSRVVAETLSFHQYDALFIDNAAYHDKKEILNILEDLLCYLQDVDHKTIKVVAILGQVEHECLDEIQKLCECHRQKVVIIQQTSNKLRTDLFYVHNLVDEDKKKLFHEYENQIILGTVTPLKSIIEEDDDLGLLLNVLKLCQQPEKLEKYNSVVQHFKYIEPWYIQREHRSPYSYREKIDPWEVYSLPTKIDGFTSQETVPISVVTKSFDNEELIKMFIKQHVMLANVETQHPPGLGKDENHSKVDIFLDDAGEGKTTYFTWMTWHLSTYDPSLYVIKLIALEYSTDFERLEESGIEDWSDDQMVRFLYRLIHLTLFVPNVCRRTIEETDVHREEADRCAEALSLSNGQIALDNSKTKELTTKQVIELRLFREKFNRKQLILILDGFDEIAPDYKDVVMKLFARFSHFKGIRNIYLSSRPYDFNTELRNAFPNCQMHRLKSFSTFDVYTFLHKRLAFDVDDYKQCEDDQQLNFLIVLLGIIIRVLGDSLTVPLLLDMAYVTLLPSIREHVNFKANTISGSFLKRIKLDITEVVEKFVEKKMEILLTDKSGTTNAAASTPAAKKRGKQEKKRITEKHMLLAMCALFDSDDRAKLLSKKEKKRVKKYLKEVKKAEEKTGIIFGVQDGRPQFVHRLFAEYFVACWLFKNIERFKQEPVFKSQVIWKYSMEKVREFFNRLIVRESEGCELHLAALDQNRNLLIEFSINNPVAFIAKDRVGRSVFHIVIPNNSKLTDFSDEDPLNTVEVMNHRDNLFGWNALDYALVLNKFDKVKGLLGFNVELNVEILMQQLLSNDTDDLIKQCIEIVEILQSCKQLTIANEIGARVVELLFNEKELDIFAPRRKLDSLSVFETCAIYSYDCMFLQFVKQFGKPLSQVLPAGMGDRLLQTAFQKRAHKAMNNLIEQCDFPLPSIIDTDLLYNAIRYTIEEYDFPLFEKLFQQLCLQMNIVCTDDIEEEVHEPLEVDFGNDFDGGCCFKCEDNLQLSVPKYKPYDIDEEHIMDFLLAIASRIGNVRITSYMLQKTNMTVTNRLIVTIMRFIAEQRFVNEQITNHNESIPVFQYLLNKTIDLRAVDEYGRNLLHMTLQNGCAYMVPCLIAKGFDPTEINPQNGWNGLHYLISSLPWSTHEHGLQLFKWLEPYFENFLINGNTVYESALDFCLTKSIWFAHIMFQTANRSSSEAVRQNALYSLVQRIVSQHDMTNALNALLYVQEIISIDGKRPDAMWFKVYNDFLSFQKNSS